MNASPFYCPNTINFAGTLMDLEPPCVMGVINITDDSFYTESRVMNRSALLLKVSLMLSDGASIIDLGAMSSRPGASNIPVHTEIERLQWACETIRNHYPQTMLSIDTFRIEVLKALEQYKINMVNDICGGQLNDEIYHWAGQYHIPYVLMHMKGTPQSMKSLALYDDIVREMLDYYIERIPKVLAAGVHDIIIDPGFGFAKTIDHNFYLLKHLHVFQVMEFPLMVGLSRKSMIWKTLEVSPNEALNGTTALHMQALMQGARILRVHDVKEAVETVKLWGKINQPLNQ